MNLDRLIPSLFVGLTFAVWIGFDIYLAKMGYATESMILRDWAKHCTFFAFLMGFLCGHWFMPRRVLWASGWMYALPILGILGIWDIVWAIWVKTFPWYRYSLIWLLLGIPSGSFLWGQGDGDAPF